MKKVWVLHWTTNSGLSGIGGVFEKRETAIKEVLNLFEVGEEETDPRLIMDNYVIIYTNYGDYTIELRMVL